MWQVSCSCLAPSQAPALTWNCFMTRNSLLQTNRRISSCLQTRVLSYTHKMTRYNFLKLLNKAPSLRQIRSASRCRNRCLSSCWGIPIPILARGFSKIIKKTFGWKQISNLTKTWLLRKIKLGKYSKQCSRSVTFWYGSGSLDPYTGLRIQIRLFTAIAFKMPNKKWIFLKVFFLIS